MPYETDAKVVPLIPQPLVLVVDDHPLSRAIVIRMVRSLGYATRSCSNGRGALRFLTLHPGAVHLLLTDLDMLRMDGGELAERARDLEPALSIALMGGPTDPHVDELREGYSTFAFLVKPVRFGDLAATLAGVLGVPPRRGEPQPVTPRRVGRRRASGQHRM